MALAPKSPRSILRKAPPSMSGPQERDWLFDPGGERDFKRVVRSYLRSRGVNRLDGLVLTHGDATHIGGADAVMQAFQTAAVG